MTETYPFKPEICRAMAACGYAELTPVQSKCIPLLLSEKQVICQASTGAGKTAAFLIPSLQRIDETDPHIQFLIIEPTRELALQTEEETSRLAVYTGIHHTALVGGMNIRKQINRLHQGVQLIAATPGRLKDLFQQNELDFSHLKSVILDEADQILSTGQKDDTNEVLMHCRCPVSVFSATISDEVRSFIIGDATEVILDPIRLNQKLTSYYLRTETKKETLLLLLHHLPITSAIVFVKYKDEAGELAAWLQKNNILAEPFSSFYQEHKRLQILDAFRNGDIRVLVATDAAARGLDLMDVSHIIHYDLPEDYASFVHRSGRSAHQNNTGTVIILLNSSDVLTKLGRTILQTSDPLDLKEEGNDLSVPLTKKQKASPHVTTILLRAGKKQKMRPKDIIGALCTYYDFKEIGVLDIQDTYSTVTILKEDKDILSRLANLTIKGKHVRVEPVRNAHL